MPAPGSARPSALLLVADGGRALLLRGEGWPGAPALALLRELTADPNPPDRAQASDRPGRLAKSGARRAAMESRERHRDAEARFAAAAAEAFAAAAEAEPDASLVIAAAPQTLAVLRRSLPERLRDRICREIDKDLVRRPLPEIAQMLLT